MGEGVSYPLSETARRRFSDKPVSAKVVIVVIEKRKATPLEKLAARPGKIHRRSMPFSHSASTVAKQALLWPEWRLDSFWANEQDNIQDHFSGSSS